MRWIVFWLVILGFILVPFFLFEQDFNALSDRIAGGGFPRWIAALLIAALLAGDIVLPVPSSLVGTASGAILGFAGGAAVGWIGLMVGSMAGYGLGYRAGRGAAQRFLGDGEFARMTRAAERFGDWIVVVFRAVPVLAEASVFFAGMTRMPFTRFCLLAGLSNLGISAVYAGVGSMSVKTESFLFAFGAAVALPGIAMLLSRRVR